MAKVRGITIELNGDASGFEKSLKDVNSSISETKKSLKDIDKLLKLDPTNIELLTQKQSNLQAAITATSTKLDVLRSAAEHANEALAQGEMSQTQYDALQREIISTEGNLKRLEKQATETNAALGSAKADASSLASFAGACDSVAAALQPIAAIAGVAAAGIIGLATSAAASADDLMTMSQQTGMSTDALQAFQQAANSIDVDFNTVISAVTKMKKNIDSSADSFAKIGVNVKTANGDLKSTEQIFFECVSALGQINNETERDVASMKIFGSKANELAGLIDDGGAAFARMTVQASKMGTLIPESTLSAAAQFNTALDNIKDSLSAAFSAAGSNVAASLAGTMEILAAAAEKVAEFIAKIPAPVLISVVVFAALVAGALSVVVALGNVARAILAIQQVAPILAATITGTIIPAIKSFGVALASLAANPMVLEILAVVAVLALLAAAIYGVVSNFDSIQACFNKTQASASGASAALNNVSNTMNETASSAGNMASEISEGTEAMAANAQKGSNLFLSALNYMKEDTVSVLSNMKSVFESSGGGITGAFAAIGAGIATDFGNGLSKINSIANAAFSTIGSAVRGPLNSALSAIKEFGSNAKDALVNGIKNASNGFFGVINSFPDKLRSALASFRDALVDSVSKPFEELIQKASKWGSDLMDLFSDGITSNSGKATSAARNVANNVKDYLGFSEPDKGPLSNFHTFAPDMIDLWVKGVKDNMYKVTDITNSLAETMVPNNTITGQTNATAGSTNSSINYLTEMLSNQLNRNTNVNVILEGDAQGVFKLVRQENIKMIQSTGYHALA